MMPTDDRSRIRWHSSKPSISGSIRSSSTMSGCSTSSKRNASPPPDTTTSKPRTTRLERTRSTMFRSSSMRRTPVVSAAIVALSRCRLDRQRDEEGRTNRYWLKHDMATMRFHDPVRDRQPETGSGHDRRAPRVRLEDLSGQRRREAGAIVGHPHLYGERVGSLRSALEHACPGWRVTNGVVDEIHQDLLQAVVVTPYRADIRLAVHLDRVTVTRDTRHGGVDHQV